VRSSLGKRLFLKRCISHRACCLKKQEEDHRLHARHACEVQRGQCYWDGMIHCLNARLNKKKLHVLAVGIDLAALGKDLDRHQRNQMTSKVPPNGSSINFFEPQAGLSRMRMFPGAAVTSSASSNCCNTSSACPSRWYPWLQSGRNLIRVAASMRASEARPAHSSA